MRKILCLFGIALLLSCQKENNDFCGCLFFDLTVEMSVVDKNGTDLLDPKNPLAIDRSKIKLFYPENGILKEVFNPLGDYPRDFMIYPVEGKNYRIRVFTTTPITYIQWSDADTDTLKCEYIKTDNSTICSKVWFNDAPVYDIKDGKERYFEVVK